MPTVIVPWRAGCPHREAAWRWVRERYAEHHPNWAIVEACAPEGPWVKARAVGAGLRVYRPARNRVAVSEDGSEVVVVADADVWCEGIPVAVEAVEDGAPWAVPHYTVNRLSREATAGVLAGGDPWDVASIGLDQRPYQGVIGGGILVARRETLLEVPMDPRFVGWGQEDESYGYALTCLAGRAWRGAAPLVHLWHPSAKRLDRRWGSIESKQLRKRYRAGLRDPDAMRALIEEIR